MYISTGCTVSKRVDLEVNGVECIWLEMLFPYSKSFLIVLFTDHQTRQDITQKDFEAQFESALSTVASENKEIILTGDVNCNYLVNSDHKEIKSIINSYGLKQLLTTPTGITTETKTLIDII